MATLRGLRSLLSVLVVALVFGAFPAAPAEETEDGLALYLAPGRSTNSGKLLLPPPTSPEDTRVAKVSLATPSPHGWQLLDFPQTWRLEEEPRLRLTLEIPAESLPLGHPSGVKMPGQFYFEANMQLGSVRSDTARVTFDAPGTYDVDVAIPGFALPLAVSPGSIATVSATFYGYRPSTTEPYVTYLINSTAHPSHVLLPGSSVVPPPPPPPGGIVPVPFYDSAEDGAGDWSADGLWHITTDAAATGAHAWYFGGENGPGLEDNSYDVNGTAAGSLVSPLFDLRSASAASLSFWQRWDGEGCPFEHPLVQASTNGTWSTLLEACAESGEGLASVDLGAFVGGLVTLRFRWDSLDGADNDREGWYADDIAVTLLAGDPPTTASSAIRFEADGRVVMDVPTDVVLIGFEPGTAAALAAELPRLEVRHRVYNNARLIPVNPGQPIPPADLGLGAYPDAVFAYHEMDATVAADLRAFLASNVARASPLLYDANAAEDWLAQRLAAEGVVFDADRPAFVFVHDSDLLPEHRYRYTYEHGGALDNVRVFGGRHPFLVLDGSAEPDFFAGTFAGSYLSPFAAGGPGAVSALASALEDASHFRLLQGPLYPPSRDPCHAVTLVLAVRATSVTNTGVFWHTARELVDVERLDAAFENMTGVGTVYTDLVPLLLPVEDPALDALARAASVTSTPLELLRFWVDSNWDRYWVPHDGCEPYVSFLLFGDFGDVGGYGIAMHDVRQGHRISFSIEGDLYRVFDDYQGPLLGGGDTDWINHFYSHETGHLLGARHPHDVSLATGSRGGVYAFSSTWTTMSYQVGDRTSDFGLIDRANFMRNRAGLALRDARDLGLLGTEAHHDAVRALALNDWEGAYEALRPYVA